MEIERKSEGHSGSWGSWLTTGWTSWYGYEPVSATSNSSDDAKSSKVTFNAPVSAGQYVSVCPAPRMTSSMHSRNNLPSMACLLLPFPNPKNVHISNLRSINLI